MRMIYGRARISLVMLLLSLCFSASAQWPKTIPVQQGGKINIYQPQSESLEGVKITGRAAVSVQKTEKSELVFGAIFFEAFIATNKDNRTAVLESLKITNAKFPGLADTNNVSKLIIVIQNEVPKWNLEISLDRLIASIKLENEGTRNDLFKNDPPEIFYRNKPTTLVIIDGEPRIRQDKNLDVKRVVNTPFLIFEDGRQWHLYSGGIWYRSDSITAGWTQNKKLSRKVSIIDHQIKEKERESNGGNAPLAKPEPTDILVSTVPAELLQTKGEPELQTVKGSSLLYVSNTNNDIFINAGKIFVLLAGRWYRADAKEGPWTYMDPLELPIEFKNIPEGSEKDNVLASVPGTPAAEEAKIEAQIPQTAKVNRKTATMKVEYDGDPQFKPIEGSSLQLAENANLTVLKDSEGKFYALDNGVWFSGSTANGPWTVAEKRPKDIETVPASSPAYNTKFVYVYESTPEYIYTGYTAGYLGSYVYGSTIVYGTGYYYSPWYSVMYYPGPATWGYGFSYNPWYGWGMNVGVAYDVGFMTIGISVGVSYGYGYGYGYGGWYGPPMYRPPFRPGYGGGYYGGSGLVRINNGPIINTNHVNNNVYRNRQGVATRDINRGATANRNVNHPAARTANTSNNVFADRNGNTYRRDDKGNWSQRDNSARQWKQGQYGNEMNREAFQRDRGATRENYHQQWSRPAGGFQGGGMRGGGGRRG